MPLPLGSARLFPRKSASRVPSANWQHEQDLARENAEIERLRKELAETDARVRKMLPALEAEQKAHAKAVAEHAARANEFETTKAKFLTSLN
jgi:uncharacterized protein YhaN